MPGAAAAWVWDSVVIAESNRSVDQARIPGLIFGCSVCTPLWGSRAELQEVIALAQHDRIHVDAQYFSLDEGPRVLQDLREGRGMGRGVLVPELG